MYLQSRI